MKKLTTKIFYILPVVGLLSVYGCKPPVQKFSSPKGYDLEKPDKFNMPESLLEISGVALYNGQPDTLYSIQDEDGKVYRQSWDVKKQKNVHFASKGDYEDLAILKGKVFVLKSTGLIYSFPFSETVMKDAAHVKQQQGMLPKGEYESLYADTESGTMYVLCKSCAEDKKTKKVSGYIFDYDTAADSLVFKSNFSIDLEPIKALNPKLKASLSPSALTKNPKTGEWYILSSANKLLLVADGQWNIKQVHRLNSGIFNQPEGIVFDKDLNLYISNEGDELTNGNILKFRFIQ